MKHLFAYTLAGALLFGNPVCSQQNIFPLYGMGFAINAFEHTSLELNYGIVGGFLYYKGRPSVIDDRSCMVVLDIGSEFQLSRPFLVGPKVSSRFALELRDWEFHELGLIYGADYIAYTDFNTVNQVVRPVIGFHYFLDLFELTYGYNFRVDNHAPLPLSTHVIQLKCKPFVFIKPMSHFADK